MKLTDIHSHILPGLDDGAKNERESLEMMKIASGNGIREIIATPHFHYRRGNAGPEKIRRVVGKMQRLADEAGIPIRLYPGNELYYTSELLEAVRAGKVLTMADSDYVLLEFSEETEKSRIRQAVYEFLNAGYYPIIAHMERYLAFWKHDGFAGELFQAGALFQINAGSLSGNSGWRVKHFARSMVKEGMIGFIATDAHNSLKRCPDFGNAAEWIERKYGKDRLYRYLRENPKMILENRIR